MRSKINTLVKHKKWQDKQKWILVALLAIAVATGIMLVSHKQTRDQQIATHIPSEGPAKQSAKKQTGKTANTGGNGSVSDKSTGRGTTLTPPSGTFVSNHRPSLSGSDLLKHEESVCNTAPGATCYILFMKDGIVKQLDPQTADSSGSTSWSWDIGQAGLTEGAWKITAVATLNGQTLSADDSLKLEVQP